jgi:hypothetical protein
MSEVLAAAARVVQELERAGFDYALSGAVALAYWARPRATLDIDIAVDAGAMQLPSLLTALRAAGCEVHEDRAIAAAQRGDFGVKIQGMRVDVFLPVLELSSAAMERRVQVAFGAGHIWILAPEDLALFKLMFGRTRDFADLEQLFAMQRDRLDYAYMDRWVSTMFSANDSRARKYHELKALARNAP